MDKKLKSTTNSALRSNSSTGSSNEFTTRMKAGWDKSLSWLGSLGKALQFPIAVLPFAALLNRFGALGLTYTTDAHGDITNQVGYWISFIIQKPGGVIFDNLALFFAIGVGFGFAKDHRGEAALASVAFFFVMTGLLSEHGIANMMYDNVNTFTWTDDKSVVHHSSSLLYAKNFDTNGNVSGATFVLDIGVLGGIVAGVITSILYNRFKEIKLPKAMSFFGGRRFIPMMAIVFAIPMAFMFAVIWPWIQLGLNAFGQAVAGSGDTNISQGSQNWISASGAAGYGFINRLLLPFGLHQVLNTLLWFQVPITGVVVDPITGAVDPNAAAVTVNGDINAFTAGVYGSGVFQSGFFPIMMGGLPAAVVAMIFAAKKENRVNVAGFLGGAAGISFLTGITEPIEYSFVFLSPVLLLLHAALSAVFCFIVVAMRIEVGFGFSAGFVDYAISIPQAWGFAQYTGELAGNGAGVMANPLWILPITAGAFAAYFFSFLGIIKWMDIKTPGREEDVSGTTVKPAASLAKGKTETKDGKKVDKYQVMAEIIIEAIGADNFTKIDNCATRLRLDVKDSEKVDQAKVKSSGVFGIKVISKESIQIVVGPDVEHVASAMQKIVKLTD
ncbi:PTS transporter subunit EIIC [Spiroplasma endosymbiont of Amphibalanus improvisus]|uniref:PTS transporter subunit EIIC n=1 Tax=Spiroplasma endosymbiont of Amphibalanus improvisus TaxID=3066327 RepID=UPI00313EA623